MRIVIFTHPSFMPSQSMPRFVRLLTEGLRQRGHQIETLTPRPRLSRLAGSHAGLRKWLGYVDQFILFPIEFLLRRPSFPANTLFVFSDQALGPWVPLVNRRPHLIHCHDFLALRSALGEWAQNPISRTGRLYQHFIRWGFRHGRNFISDSHATHRDLSRFLEREPALSTTIHIGLNYPFCSMPAARRLKCLKLLGIPVPDEGFLLHVGGNLWYKNRLGVIALYRAYAEASASPLPLWMMGSPPTAELQSAAQDLTKGSVRFITEPTDVQIHAAYSHATALLFPSYAEGFGWPIAEAMACGCPVITSDSAPMTEVGGPAALYIATPGLDDGAEARASWARQASARISEVVSLDAAERLALQERGFEQARLFDQSSVIPRYEALYQQIINHA